MMDTLGWIGTYAGPAGAILLALNIRVSPYGYVLFLLSSVAMVVYASWIGDDKVLIQNVLFTAINSVGLVRWVILPCLRNRARRPELQGR